MKKIFLYIAITVGLLSCNHKDSLWQEVVEDLDERVETLEMLCAEMNTNITSLQTIVDVLQSNDFITSIVEIKKDGKVVGYTITFGKHDPITIYHGQDGKDGADGKDGQDGQDGADGKDGQNGADGKDGITPVIGVAQDTDGVYYWTLNGEWLLDDNGNKLPVSGKDGKDGANGTDGQDGQDGADGKDGISPLLKIENGYWYISYDNGATWTESGKATGDNGQDGQNGTDGKDGQDGANGQDGVTPLLKIENGYWYISYDNGATWAQLGKATGEDGKDGANGTNGTDGKDGQDGADGSNGQDGITPQLKIENGYWYVSYDNGTTWTQFGKATGADGQDGQNGTDGKDGQDGKDGVTPQLKIEEGYWFISYDNGATWTQLGKATGEDGKDGVDGEDGKDGQNGADGKDGQDGDSMFQSVTQDENYVYFTLADGTVIKIAKASEEEQPNSEFMFIVTYHANGGEGTMKPDTFYYGVSKQLSEIKYTNSSHYFTNWNTKADGTGIPYEDGQTLMISKNITLYAQWEIGNKELFSVSESTTITFSPGNLSYNSSTKKWSFASSLGGGSLLGWSGSRTYNYGVSTSPITNDYSGDFVDWGNLTIDSYPPKTWRTLTSSEWGYVLNKRKNASDKKGVARVNGTSGLILLPDFWECPKDINFVSGFVSTDFTNAQSFTTEQWALLENAGAIFLPASGTRWNTNTSDYGKKGSYWTPNVSSNYVICMEFTATSIALSSLSDYPSGKSVRLVKDIQ